MLPQVPTTVRRQWALIFCCHCSSPPQINLGICAPWWRRQRRWRAQAFATCSKWRAASGTGEAAASQSACSPGPAWVFAMQGSRWFGRGPVSVRCPSVAQDHSRPNSSAAQLLPAIPVQRPNQTCMSDSICTAADFLPRVNCFPMPTAQRCRSQHLSTPLKTPHREDDPGRQSWGPCATTNEWPSLRMIVLALHGCS